MQVTWDLFEMQGLIYLSRAKPEIFHLLQAPKAEALRI